jgi:hypothetical protein
MALRIQLPTVPGIARLAMSYRPVAARLAAVSFLPVGRKAHNFVQRPIKLQVLQTWAAAINRLFRFVLDWLQVEAVLYDCDRLVASFAAAEPAIC